MTYFGQFGLKSKNITFFAEIRAILDFFKQKEYIRNFLVEIYRLVPMSYNITYNLIWNKFDISKYFLYFFIFQNTSQVILICHHFFSVNSNIKMILKCIGHKEIRATLMIPFCLGSY